MTNDQIQSTKNSGSPTRDKEINEWAKKYKWGSGKKTKITKKVIFRTSFSETPRTKGRDLRVTAASNRHLLLPVASARLVVVVLSSWPLTGRTHWRCLLSPRSNKRCARIPGPCATPKMTCLGCVDSSWTSKSVWVGLKRECAISVQISKWVGLGKFHGVFFLLVKMESRKWDTNSSN